jgi:Fe-S-cluster-containing dehydrogenase component
MGFTRREALKSLGAGAVGVAATSLVSIQAVAAEPESKVAPKHAVGLLYDTTRCVGCQSCVAACNEVNNLEGDLRADRIHHSAQDLNSFAKNIIKLYRPAGGTGYSFVKQQCMHCVDPACVAGCSFKALTKNPETGVVGWASSKCMGCRYCEITCPYHIPKFQWEGWNPKIVKCELCKERLAEGKEPACSTVCPAKAVIFGTREQLLAEAKRRISETPGKYFENRVFGETDGGGTQALYLSHVPFEKIGLPNLGNESVPDKYLKWQKRLYSYLAVPVVAYATMVAVIRKNWDDHQEHMNEEQKRTGLRPQL